MKINYAPGKTEVIHNKKRSREEPGDYTPEQLHVGSNKPINMTTEYKYLGVITDGSGRDDRQIDMTIKKSRRALAKMKNIIRTETWMAPAIKLALLNTCTRAVMLYGIPIWAPMKLKEAGGSQTGLKQLATLYNTGIR